MSLRMITNVASINAQRQLYGTQRGLDRTFQRLSSGLRINTAADDAAGLAITEQLKSQIRSIGQAERNASDGLSMLQVAEGAMNEMSNILIRMRELAVQAANDTLGNTEKGHLQTEFGQLQEEMDRIAGLTEFNGIQLLDGSVGNFDFQVGIEQGGDNVISLTLPDVQAAELGVDADADGAIDAGAALTDAQIGPTDDPLDGNGDPGAAFDIIDGAIATLVTSRATIGATQNRLESAINNLQASEENLSAANSRIRDADIAEETANLTRYNILMQAGTSILSQANQAPQLALSLLQN